MKDTRIYDVKFNKPEYDATYTFVRCESGAFAYGNRSMVVVYRNDQVKETIDTRYDKTVMKDFTAWCEEYLSNAFNPDYAPTWGLPKCRCLERKVTGVKNTGGSSNAKDGAGDPGPP